MKCILVGDRARVLAKFLQYLHKIGQDLFIEATEDDLILGSQNSSKTAFASIKLCRGFFQDYSVDQEQIETGENFCRVSLKACLPIFRSLKNVECCDIRMNQSASKLIIQLHCRENTTKTHFVSILQRELVSPINRHSSQANTLTATHKVFADILILFNANEEELTVDATKTGVHFKNYVEALHRGQLRTQLCLEPGEFDTYIVDTETTVTFCLKEWRAFLVLAEALNTNITIQFETTGLPIEFALHDLDIFEVNLIMATLAKDLDSSCNSSVIILSGETVVGGGATYKRTHDPDNVDGELNALLKRPKGRSKAVADVSMAFLSNPDIEDWSKSNVTEGPGSNNRWTVARSADGNNLAPVPTIETRVSTLSPRPAAQNQSHNVDVIFLKDTEEDTDRTLLSIKMPQNDDQPSSMRTIAEEEDDVIPMSPDKEDSRVKRRAARQVFRRIFEPPFNIADVSGLNRIMAPNSDDEDQNH